MERLLLIKFLESFFKLFKARIEDYKIIGEKIFGIVGWIDDDERQDFVFKENFSETELSNVKLLCDFISENKIIEGDRIIVSESELIQKLKNEKWGEVEAKMAIDSLCNLDIKMIDEGEEPDSFFVHF